MLLLSWRAWSLCVSSLGWADSCGSGDCSGNNDDFFSWLFVCFYKKNTSQFYIFSMYMYLLSTNNLTATHSIFCYSCLINYILCICTYELYTETVPWLQLLSAAILPAFVSPVFWLHPAALDSLSRGVRCGLSDELCLTSIDPPFSSSPLEDHLSKCCTKQPTNGKYFVHIVQHKLRQPTI